MQNVSANEADAGSPIDLLYGVKAIARCIGLTEAQARHLCENGTVPTFKIGKLICTRRSTLARWLTQAERGAIEAAGGDGEPETA